MTEGGGTSEGENTFNDGVSDFRTLPIAEIRIQSMRRMMSLGTEGFGAASSAECEDRHPLFHIRMKWVANMKRNTTAAEKSARKNRRLFNSRSCDTLSSSKLTSMIGSQRPTASLSAFILPSFVGLT